MRETVAPTYPGLIISAIYHTYAEERAARLECRQTPLDFKVDPIK